MAETISLSVANDLDESSADASRSLRLQANRDLPAVDTSSEALLFLLGAFILEFLVWGYGYAFGVLQDYYASETSPFYGSSATSIASIGTVGIGLQYMLGIFFEPLYKAYPKLIKPSMWVSLVTAASCFLVSSWATQIWHLVVSQGVIFGITSAALYFPVIVWLSEWFYRRRSLAAGIIFGGSSAGGVLFPFFFRYLLDLVGFANAMRIWSGFFLIVGALAITIVKPRVSVANVSGPAYPANLRFPDLGFLSTRPFLMFASTVMAQRLAYTPITILIASYANKFAGVTTIESTSALVLLNFSGMIGLIIQGYAGDRVNYWKISCISGILSALVAGLILGFAQNLAMLYVFVLCYGVVCGGYAATWTTAAKALKDESSGTIFLAFSFIGGIATIVGPLIAASLQTVPSVLSSFGSHGFRDVVIFITSNMTYVAFTGLIIGLGHSRWRSH